MQQLWTVLFSYGIIFQPLLFTKIALGKPSVEADYDCDYNDYALGTTAAGGKCYPCPYQESRTCFRSNVCVHYKNAVIYTLDGPDWEKYL